VPSKSGQCPINQGSAPPNQGSAPANPGSARLRMDCAPTLNPPSRLSPLPQRRCLYNVQCTMTMTMYNDNVRMHRYLRANHFKLIEMMGYLPVDQMIQVRATLEDAGMRALAEIQGQSSNDQGRFVAGVCQVRSNSRNDLALFTNLCIGITRRGTITGQRTSQKGPWGPCCSRLLPHALPHLSLHASKWPRQ
jgi:hypothetical protein